MTRIINWLKDLKWDWLKWDGTANVIGIATLVLGVAGFLVLWCTLRAVQTESKAANTEAEIALGSQRARLTFGLADGRAAKYVPPARGRKKGTIILYFRNIGPQLAPKVLINAFSYLPPPVPPSDKKLHIHHLFRFEIMTKIVSRPSRGKSYPVIEEPGGVPVDVGNQYDFRLAQKWVPTPRQWAAIQRGLNKLPFRIAGTFEYCDSWGVWRCEPFDALYDSSLGKFVPSVSLFGRGSSLRKIPSVPRSAGVCGYLDWIPTPKKLLPRGGPPIVKWKFLPPCVQPDGNTPN